MVDVLQEKLKKMIDLQQVDLQIAENRKILKRLGRQKIKFGQEMEALRLNEVELEQKLKESSRQSKIMEHELQDFEVRFKKEQKKFLEVTSTKEMEAVQHEIDNVLTGKQEMEEGLFNLLVEIEVMQKDLVKLREGNRQEKEAIEKQIETNQSRTVTVETDYQKLLVERKDRSALLDIDHLKLYEKICEEKAGKAIVVVTDYTCQGCYLDLPKGTINEIRSNAKLTECNNCGRLLYWDGVDL